MIYFLFACNKKEKFDCKIPEEVFLENGFLRWDELNMLHKSKGDTSYIIGLDSNRFAVTKSIFIPFQSSDSTFENSFRKKGYTFLYSNDFGSNRVFMINANFGNLYEVIQRNDCYEINQKNACGLLNSEF